MALMLLVWGSRFPPELRLPSAPCGLTSLGMTGGGELEGELVPSYTCSTVRDSLTPYSPCPSPRVTPASPQDLHSCSHPDAPLRSGRQQQISLTSFPFSSLEAYVLPKLHRTPAKSRVLVG